MRTCSRICKTDITFDIDGELFDLYGGNSYTTTIADEAGFVTVFAHRWVKDIPVNVFVEKSSDLLSNSSCTITSGYSTLHHNTSGSSYG